MDTCTPGKTTEADVEVIANNTNSDGGRLVVDPPSMVVTKEVDDRVVSEVQDMDTTLVVPSFSGAFSTEF